MKKDAIGVVELSSIAAGFAVVDTMLKTGDIELLVSRTICSGKYLAVIGGNVADVRASVEAGGNRAGVALIDQCVLGSIHETVFPAIAGNVEVHDLNALGVLESFSVTALIEAADAAAKAAEVQLVEIRLAMALGGKAYATMTGDVSSVQAAVDAGVAKLSESGMLVNHVVIPRPESQLLNEII